GTPATLGVVQVSGLSYNWYDSNGTLVASNTASYATPNNLAAGSYDYFVEAVNGSSCSNSTASRTRITISVNPGPILPVVATAGTTICAGNSTVLSIVNPQANVIYEWYDDATGSAILTTGTSYPTLMLNTSRDYYVRAVGTAGCTSATARVKVTVTVTTKPLAPTVTLSTVSICTGSSATLSVSNPIAGVTYSWYTTAMGGTAITTGSTYMTNMLNANAVYYVEASVGSCTSINRTEVNVEVVAIPIAPTNVMAANAQLCAGASTILTVNNPNANLNYRWYTTSTGGTSLYEGNSYSTGTLSLTTIFYVESVSKVAGCVSSTRTAVTVNVATVLPAPVVRVDNVTSKSILFTWNTVAGALAYEVSINGGTTWTAPTDGPVGTSYLVLGLSPLQSVTIIVRAKGQTDCQNSANSIAVTGKTTDPFGNELYVPNTFTPNGDGKNDLFLAYGNAVSRFRMRIYNQWGQFIYEAQSINQGWDGTHKGTLQPSGVYVYYIDVTFESGTSKMFKGTITLLR
ncbi:gliding motility-associated C-terminal domain-containing protein, partial [Pedobacter sp. ASV28]|uniref:gliding motility-associated C-terminal domain-containing protein n=1 Tax=Pedobacter sp. ASV28 TaxID=2795123 RepID=UPI0018EAA05D